MAIVPPGGLLTAAPLWFCRRSTPVLPPGPCSFVANETVVGCQMIVPAGRAKELTKYMQRLRLDSRWLPNAGTTIEAP
jgi:hypothetical protein